MRNDDIRCFILDFPNIDHMKKENPGFKLVKTLGALDPDVPISIEILSLKPVQQIIDLRYDLYKPEIVTHLVIPNMLFMFFYGILIMNSDVDPDNVHDDTGVNFILSLLVVMLSFKILYNEYKQMKFMDGISYIKSFWNILDLLAVFMVLYCTLKIVVADLTSK